MSSTKTFKQTLQTVLDQANLAFLTPVLKLMKLGQMLSAIKVVAAALTPAASFDITTAAFLAKCTVTGIQTTNEDPTLVSLPPVLAIRSLRVTANTGGTFVGTYVLTDKDGDMLTAATHTVVGVAQISDDGKTITFPTNDVTAFTIEYVARSAVDMQTEFAPQS